MATTKKDPRAEKERKQKIILAVGGVLLVGVVALQGPKLLNHFKSSPAAAPATTPGATTPGATTTPTDTTAGSATAAPTIPTATPTKYSAQLAGVVITPSPLPSAGTGQLWSFSRFKVKDPFVQQVSQTNGSSSPSAGTTTAPKGGAPKVPTTPAIGSPQAAAPSGPLTNATLLVNGHPQRLVVHQLFPKGDPMFVLVKLTKDTARIGVAGGSFTAGNTLLLEKGKAVTLMNTTTGQRYVVKLVYTGLVPEEIAGFKAPQQAAGSGSVTTTVPAPATTTPTTTTSSP